MTAQKHIPDPVQLPMFDPIVIKLTQGYETVVDAIDGDLAELKWQAQVTRNRPYARRHAKWHDKEYQLIHLVIMERILNRPLQSHELIDHADNNSLNNRRANLRLATTSQNNQNSKRRSDNKSGYKGVHKHTKTKWRARVQADGKRIDLGTFYTPEEAYAAYCEAAKKIHGEFARLE